MTIIDNAVYVDGVRTAEPEDLEQTFETLGSHGGMAWIGLYRPSTSRDGRRGGGVRPARSGRGGRYLGPPAAQAGALWRQPVHGAPAGPVPDDTESVEFGELHVFVGKNFVVTVRHAEMAGVGEVRRRLESRPDLLRHGPEAVLYALLDQVVDDYAPVVAGLENDIDEIEDQLFSGDPAVSRRIYELAREVIQFQRAIHPLPEMMQQLRRGFEELRVDTELQHNLRDVEDHVERVISRADSFRTSCRMR